MATLKGEMDFLADLPLYKTQKPYLILPKVEDGWAVDDPRLTNLKWISYRVPIHDMRGGDFNLDTAGFQQVDHESANLVFDTIASKEAYMLETEAMLRDLLKAEFVKCYDSVVTN